MHSTQLKIINQLFDIEKKINRSDSNAAFQRNFERIRQYYEEANYIIVNPVDEPYNETRTDCEASITGDSTDKLFIKEVIKPIVYFNDNASGRTLVQKGIVIAG